MKKLSRSVYLVLIALFLILSVGLAVIFHFAGPSGYGFLAFAPSDNIDLGIYIAVKAFVSLALIAILIVHLTGKRQEGVMVVDMIFTLAIQVLPLFVRGIGQIARYVEGASSWVWAINLGVCLLVLFIYTAIVLLITLSNHRLFENKAKVKPESEKVVERNADTALDQDGNFVGPNSKKK